MTLALVGATGRTGTRVLRRLRERGHAVLALGHRQSADACIDLERGSGLELLASAELVVSCAHAKYTAALLRAAPRARCVLMGSVRRYLTIPDPDGEAIAEAERAFLASGRPGVMLHASMIYGAPDDGNVSRVRAAVRRWPLPVIPWPGAGTLIQPIHVEDVAAAVVAAVERPQADGPPIILAGPRPLPYGDLVRACAGRKLMVLPLPARLLAAALAPVRPRLAAEVRRMAEDKAFDPRPMIDRLGVVPREFAP